MARWPLPSEPDRLKARVPEAGSISSSKRKCSPKRSPVWRPASSNPEIIRSSGLCAIGASSRSMCVLLLGGASRFQQEFPPTLRGHFGLSSSKTLRIIIAVTFLCLVVSRNAAMLQDTTGPLRLLIRASALAPLLEWPTWPAAVTLPVLCGNTSACRTLWAMVGAAAAINQAKVRQFMCRHLPACRASAH